uniref:Uncharacterized protein n=1 Tax=Siphoviridae sp. cti6f5 TaxID=2826430 RepID=A0A8S5MD16_9CAUD|nr:MAG TPA: hypothetical protein [Siphoviridae sp. cti6f5]
MTNVKTMVWELEGIYSFEETLFKNYDKQRRKKEFELLKELSRDFYKTNDIWQDSIRIPVFNSAKEKEFTIQIKNAINYYEVSLLFNDEEDLSKYNEKYGLYKKYVQTLTDIERVISRFLCNMNYFLGDDELYLRDVTREEHEKLINETAAAYKALKIGVI